MKIIPAIDIIDGKCVRLYKGNYKTVKVYNNNPVDQAKAFEDAGLEFLHVVDLSGAKAGKPIHLKVLEKICKSTRLKVDYGGGIRIDQDITNCLNLGANQVNLGTILIKEPDIAKILIAKLGSEKLIASADVMNRMVKIAGWQKETGSGILEVVSNLADIGFNYFTVTDIDRDGTLGEPNFKLYNELLLKFPNIKLNASGGVSSNEHLKLLKEIGCDGAIVGKAIYEGVIELLRY
jgi:phosphoribosylformimino-5-aminoimidazole carboxamide ribotide isomerase